MKLFGFDIQRSGPARHDAVPPVGFEQRMSPENPKFNLSDGGALVSYLEGMSGGQGVLVTPQSAMSTAVVYACVRIISEAVASLPLHVRRRTGTRKIEMATELPLYHVLHNQPNQFQTSYVFREHQQARTCLWGNCYAQIIRDLRTDNVMELLPLPPNRVQPEIHGGTKRFLINGGEYVLKNEDVLHIPALGMDGVCGLSPIRLMRRAIGQAIAQDQYGQSFYENGTRLSGVLEHPAKLGADAQARLRSSWTDVYAGRMNAGKVAILEEGMKFNPLSMPMSDAQFVETRKFQVSEIARIFRVPLHMVADLSKSTFSNMEQLSIEFVRDTVLAWLVRWEQECNSKLLTPEQRQTHFIKFNLGGLLRGDQVTRYTAYKIGREGGWLSVNDIREMEDMNEIDGGDTYIQPMNYTEVGKKDGVSAPAGKSEDTDGELSNED